VRPSSREFVLRHTRLQPVVGHEDVRLYLADEVLRLWRAVQLALVDPDAALPFWAFAWAGGLALARYVETHPEVVTGRRVLDLASGSGLVAIAAARAGAATVTAADIDPFAAAAIRLNAQANRTRVHVIHRDLLADKPPDADAILAGDSFYEGPLAERVLPWLRTSQRAGIDVLIGDPGRRYLPVDDLVELATYDVRTTTELEDLALKQARVYRFR
jgi:predicted nicotinamide N-methyase